MKKSMVSEQSRFPSRLTTAYLCAILGPFLLYTGTEGYAAITSGKWRAYLILTLALLLLPLCRDLELAVLGERKLRNPPQLWKELTLPQKLLLGYWLAAGVSTLLSADRAAAFFGADRRDGFLAITAYCWSCILIISLGKPRKLLLWVLGAAMLLTGVLACLQLRGGNPLGLYPEGMSFYDGNKLYAGMFLGTIGNIDVLSAVNCVAVPAFFFAWLRLRGRFRLLIVPMLLCCCVQLRSGALGGVVGIVCGILLSCPMLLQRKRARIAAWCVLLLIGLLLLVLVFFFGGQFGGFFAELSALLHGRAEDSFGSSRIFIWRNTLRLVPERLLFGGGPDTLGSRMTLGFNRYDAALGLRIHTSIDAAHSEYLNILVNEGLIALLFYLAVLVCGALRFLRSASEDPVVLICGSAVLCYCIQALFGIRSPAAAPLLWIALALLFHSEPDRVVHEIKTKEHSQT